jgi:hypothetical protein
MKTLKILIVLCIVFCFTTNAVNAQAQEYKATFPASTNFACVGELVIGEITHHVLWNGNKSLSIYSGKLIGQNTGNVYTFINIFTFKDILNENNGQQVHSHAGTALVHCNGKPVAVLHVLFHMTLNANGEMTEVKEEITDWECL